MKNLLILIAFLISCFALNAQITINEVAGTYKRGLANTSPHIINYTLNLNADGTFQFHSYDKIENINRPEKSRATERNTYGKGTWTLDEKVVTFSTSATDLDEKFALDFENSKARFISKHPRDKSDKVIETALHFYTSDIFWMDSIQMFKID